MKNSLSHQMSKTVSRGLSQNDNQSKQQFFPIKNMLGCFNRGFLAGSVVKNLPATAGDLGSVPGLGRSPGEVNDNPCQYSCLENSMDRGAWWVTVHGVAKSRT